MVVEKAVVSPRTRKESTTGRQLKSEKVKDALKSPEYVASPEEEAGEKAGALPSSRSQRGAVKAEKGKNRALPLEETALPEAEADVLTADNAESEADGGSSSVRVWCRFRPRNKMELAQQGGDCVQFPDDKTVKFQLEGEKHEFLFDQVFTEGSAQREIYEATAKPLVLDALNGFNCTVFTYGQTGSGKTHTMMGSGDGANVEDENRGVIPRVCQEIFAAVEDAEDDLEFTIKLGYIEIYLEKVRDLFNPVAKDLKVREDPNKGVYVEGMTEMYVASPAEMIDLMKKGTANRAIGCTKMNADSSRSHSVCSIMIEKRSRRTERKSIGHIYLVDLAGSETVKKTGASGQTLEEAKMINKSLSALGNVIKGLVDGKGHIPYRDSKLTRVLQDSLGGNSKTSIIITCSSNTFNGQETLSTLRFGSRAKKIKNKPKINQEKSAAELKILLAEATDQLKAKDLVIESLRAECLRLQQGHGTLSLSLLPLSPPPPPPPTPVSQTEAPKIDGDQCLNAISSKEEPAQPEEEERELDGIEDGRGGRREVELEAQITRQEGELAVLRQSREQLEASLSAQSQHLASLSSLTAELQEKLEEVRRENRNKQESYEAAEERSNRWNELKEAAESSRSLLLQQNLELQMQYEATERERERLEKEKESIVREKLQMERERERMQRETEKMESEKQKRERELGVIQAWVEKLKFSLDVGHFSDDESEAEEEEGEDNNQKEPLSAGTGERERGQKGEIREEDNNQETKSLETVAPTARKEDTEPIKESETEKQQVEAERKASLRTELDRIRKAIIDAKLQAHQLEKERKSSMVLEATLPISLRAKLLDPTGSRLVNSPEKRGSVDGDKEKKEREMKEKEAHLSTKLQRLEAQLAEARTEAANYKRLWTHLLSTSPSLQPGVGRENFQGGNEKRKNSVAGAKLRRKSSLHIHVTEALLDAFSPRTRKKTEVGAGRDAGVRSPRTEELRAAACTEEVQSPLARVFPFLFSTKQKIVKVVRGGRGSKTDLTPLRSPSEVAE